ncbi:MAG: hypothetical protein JWP57_1550 [Spirosoma sp.]|nr:hypothetical protein [Spirosoma sp.]
MKNQFLLLLCLIGGSACAQTTADEKAIRQIVDRSNAGERPNTTDNTIFWSGAYSHPRVGKVSEAEGKKMVAEFAKERSNQQQSMKIERLVVASSGDIAYEYGTFNLNFDSVSEKKHVSFDGAYLRTWRKEKGQWLVDAAFMRPFGDPVLTADKK